MLFMNLLAIALFVVPGLVSELYCLSLTGKKFSDDRLAGAVRVLCFSAVVLLLRCVISMSRGYGDLPVQDLFFGIGNVGKYILLSAVLSVLLPNAYLLVRSIFVRKRG